MIPPLIGFFSKQFVLYSSIENANYFISLIAILVSVISASYYLKIIKITFFEKGENTTTDDITIINKNLIDNNSSISSLRINNNFNNSTYLIFNLSNIHSYIIGVLTLMILFFFINPSILLYGSQLISLTIFNL